MVGISALLTIVLLFQSDPFRSSTDSSSLVPAAYAINSPQEQGTITYMTNQYISPSAKKIVEIAKAEVGYHEGKTGSHWNNKQKYSKDLPGLEWVSNQGQPWCAVFTSWVAFKAGFSALYPRTASTDVGAAWFQKAKRWSEYPAIASQGFLARGGDEYHTFLVVDYDDTYVWTVEGNTNDTGSAEGDGVYSRKRKRTDPSIEGYGYPKFPEGVVSADPAWKSKNPKAPTKTPNADAAVVATKKGLNASKRKNDVAKQAKWISVLNQLKSLSSKY